MDTIELKQWVIDNKIEKRIRDGFWNYIENYKQDDIEEYTEYFGGINFRFLTLEFRKVSLTTIYTWSCDVVSAFLDIKYKDTDIGTYEMVFSLSGEIQDDFLDMEDKNYIHLINCLEDREFEIAKLALEEGAGIEFIAKITGLSREEIEELHDYKEI